MWLIVALFVGVTLSVYGLVQLFGARDPVEERLVAGRTGARPDPTRTLVLRHEDDGRLKELERLIPVDAGERSRLQQWLARAGYRSSAAPRLYYAARFGLGLVVFALAATILPLVFTRAPIPFLVLYTIGLAVFAFFLPTLWVRRRIEYRQKAAQDGFPDALDMLLVCVEAGQALDQAMARMAAEITDAHPVLAEEFSLVGHELRAGKARGEVLRDLGRRLDVQDISAFVTVLRQSDEFGTPIGEALRVYASEMRQKRLVAAEEKANKMPIKLMIGSILLTAPAVLLIVVGPSLLQIARALSSLGSGSLMR
jgi:tight adherence protein C